MNSATSRPVSSRTGGPATSRPVSSDSEGPGGRGVVRPEMSSGTGPRRSPPRIGDGLLSPVEAGAPVALPPCRAARSSSSTSIDVGKRHAQGSPLLRGQVDRRAISQYSHFDFFPEGTVARTLSAARAKMEFADCVRRAEAGDAVVITRHGRPVAALVAAQRLEQLERLRAAGPEAGLAGLVGGWKGSGQLVKVLARSRRSRARALPKRQS